MSRQERPFDQSLHAGYCVVPDRLACCPERVSARDEQDKNTWNTTAGILSKLILRDLLLRYFTTKHGLPGILESNTTPQAMTWTGYTQPFSDDRQLEDRPFQY